MGIFILNIMEKDRHSLSVTLGIANELVSYFNSTIIGSVLLEKFICFDLINDVDVAIDESKFWNIQKFLEDKGFKETSRTYKQQGYADFIGSFKFTKEKHLPIHLCKKEKDFKLKTAPEILKEKFERYSETDRQQILRLVSDNCKL